MFTLLACLITDCAAKEIVVEECPEVALQVEDVKQQVDEQALALNGIEHFLADKQRAHDGSAPKGWMQPSIAEYLKPGAPESYIAAAPPTAVGPTP